MYTSSDLFVFPRVPALPNYDVNASRGRGHANPAVDRAWRETRVYLHAFSSKNCAFRKSVFHNGLPPRRNAPRHPSVLRVLPKKCRYDESGAHMVTCQKKRPPLTTVNFLLPVTGGHSGPNGKRACFFPVIFRSFESLSVVTDRRTDGRTDALKGCRLSNLPVERIKIGCPSKIKRCTAGNSLKKPDGD